MAAHFALGFLRTAGRAAAVVYLCVSGITVGALLPVLLAIVLIRAVCEIMSFQVAVFLAAHATLSLFRTAGRAAAVVYLCVGGIAVGTLIPVLGFVVDQHCIAMRQLLAMLLAAHFALSLFCASGRAAAVGFLFVSGIAAGALQPVIVLVVPPYRKIVAAGGDFFCLFSAASPAGKGLYARCCAGRRGGHFTFVPVVRAFLDFRPTAAILLPVAVVIGLPAA